VENIRYGRLDTTDEKVIAAAKTTREDFLDLTFLRAETKAPFN